MWWSAFISQWPKTVLITQFDGSGPSGGLLSCPGKKVTKESGSRGQRKLPLATAFPQSNRWTNRLRLQRIFSPNCSVWKLGNTYSIPLISKLSFEEKSLAERSCRFIHRLLENPPAPLIAGWQNVSDWQEWVRDTLTMTAMLTNADNHIICYHTPFPRVCL